MRDSEESDEIIISYLPSKKEIDFDKKMMEKLKIGLKIGCITCGIYLITFGILFWDFFIVAFIAVPVFLMLLIPLFLVFELYQINSRILRCFLTFITRVFMPACIVMMFEHFYGLLTISVFFMSILFYLLDISYKKFKAAKLYL